MLFVEVALGLLMLVLPSQGTKDRKSPEKVCKEIDCSPDTPSKQKGANTFVFLLEKNKPNQKATTNPTTNKTITTTTKRDLAT